MRSGTYVLNLIYIAFENNLRFPGQYYDSETGFYYNFHRYYEPDVGRYLREDPVEKGLNLYVYVLDNPIYFYDNRGLWGQKGWQYQRYWIKYCFPEISFNLSAGMGINFGTSTCYGKDLKCGKNCIFEVNWFCLGFGGGYGAGIGGSGGSSLIPESGETSGLDSSIPVPKLPVLGMGVATGGGGGGVIGASFGLGGYVGWYYCYYSVRKVLCKESFWKAFWRYLWGKW